MLEVSHLKEEEDHLSNISTMQVVMVVLNIGSVATRNHIEELYHLNFIDLSFLHVDL